MSTNPCTACKGERLRPEARAVTVCGINIMDVTGKSIAEARAWIGAIGGESSESSVVSYENGHTSALAESVETNGTVKKAAKGRRRKGRGARNGRVHVEHPSVLTERERAIAGQILKEIEARLDFLLNVGLDYLTLSRTASTLSGGRRSGYGWRRRSGRG